MGMVYTIIILLISLADQLSKALVLRNISLSERIPVIEGFFYLVNRKNTGAAWSFLAEPDWGIYFLSAVSLIITLILIIAMLRVSHKGLRLALAFISGGSIGNLIDRVRLGGVTDFLDFHFGSYVFPTFNVADTMIVIGTALLILLMLIDRKLIDEPLLPWQKKNDADGTENIF